MAGWQRNVTICVRLSFLLTTGFPLASRPQTWQSDLARSIPKVTTFLLFDMTALLGSCASQNYGRLERTMPLALRPPRKCQLVADLQKRYGVSERQACAVLQFSRASCRYQSVARDSSALSMRIREITLTRLHYGYRRVHVQLKVLRLSVRAQSKQVFRVTVCAKAYQAQCGCVKTGNTAERSLNG